MMEYYLLHSPEKQLAADWRNRYPESTTEELEVYMTYIRRRRDDHPYFNDPMEYQRGNREVSEYIITTTGTSYETAKYTAAETGSHLITDLSARWREIEIDRETAGIDLASGAHSQRRSTG